ncbi:MAG: nucleotide exchange factor GrpE [Planctomycetota bacterium]
MSDASKTDNPTHDQEANLTDEQIAEELEQGEQLTELEQAIADRDEAKDKYMRALAEVQNVQRRAAVEQQRARESGLAGVVERLAPVLDQFDMALRQDPAKTDTAQFASGVKLIRDELFRAVGAAGVEVVAPQPGDEFDPSKHEAVTYQPADGIEPGRVSIVMRFGFAIGDRLIRSAQVAVAPDAGGEG